MYIETIKKKETRAFFLP